MCYRRVRDYHHAAGGVQGEERGGRRHESCQRGWWEGLGGREGGIKAVTVRPARWHRGSGLKTGMAARGRHGAAAAAARRIGGCTISRQGH